ncbi:MAG: aminotransferase class I/II-fold pyridoxal phosphate-dependent enzyme [Candidatus Heimdallarchaeota archaeon]|nr:aminotransferase class I/II-fold pyridoxal phosphate-dependent enzyme [Candidatus Heimdallarchaeota archaeon]MCK4878047.1 aminotransferase class I/II-fold pyridoxal phosphate-dependent enzyme [Candidatus Heimdallarchaeota archaeon]
MKSHDYLSKKSLYLDERIDLSGGTKGWNNKSKGKAKELPGFINATVGTARNNDDSLLIFPTLLEEFGKLSGEQIFAYANIRGMPNFAKLWKEDTLASFPIDHVEKTDRLSTLPLTSCGLTGALTLAGEAFLDRDDSILIPNSRWGNVDNILLKNQRLKEVNYELLDKEGQLNFSDLSDKIKTLDNKGKKFGIYLNFPNNPSGISPSFEQVKILQEALSEVTTPIIILLDDAYEGYVYESDVMNYSLFPHLVGLNENVIVVKLDGVSKRYCAYGARLGAVTLGFGYEVDEEEKASIREVLAKITRSSVSNSPRGIQEAIINVLEDRVKHNRIQQERQTVQNILSNRFKTMKRITEEKETKQLFPVDYNSGFFSYFLLKNNKSATEVSKKLLDKGLGTVPFENQSSGLNGIRVAFCSIRDEDIEKTIDILYSVD